MPIGTDYQKEIDEAKKGAESLLRRYGHRNPRKRGIDSIIKSLDIKSEFEVHVTRLYELGAEDVLERIKNIIYDERRDYFSDVFNKVMKAKTSR